MAHNPYFLTCHDVAMAGLWDMDKCCSGCHAGQDKYADEMCGPAIPSRRRGSESRFFFETCCTCAQMLSDRPEPLRNLAARIAWEKHEYWRQWAEDGEDA